MKNTILIAFLAISLSMAISSCSNSTPADTSVQSKTVASEIYTCSMHPEVDADKPGDCPKCGMPLIKKEAADTTKMQNPADTVHM
jgi:hypothetical protein